ncbi:MAG: hypothetical protein WB565_13230 [Acidimicrobiales bacterium]
MSSSPDPVNRDQEDQEMTNARPEVAVQGWEIYRSTVPRPSLADINERLASESSGAVSNRMYEHYRKLERNGYRKYVPINELDVLVKRDRLRAS